MPAALIRTCGAYLHPEALVLHAQHRTTAGFGVSARPVFRLPKDATPPEVGAALRAALAAHRVYEADPADWAAHRDDFLKATGFRSWKAFEGPARCCWVEEEKGRVRFTPLKNGGTKGPQKGFQPFGAQEIVADASASDDELGKSLLTALERSQ